MGHFINGIITRETDADKIAARIPIKQYFKLQQGFAIFAFNAQLLDTVLPPPQNYDFQGFIYLCEELARILSAASSDTMICYIETEYYGGSGKQSAMAWENGKIVYGPENSDYGPINEVLKLMGAITNPNLMDEFTSVGLSRFRDYDGFLDRFATLHPKIKISVTFLSHELGGRHCLPISSGYCPYFVIPGQDDCLAVRFIDFPESAQFEIPVITQVELMYASSVDYSSLKPGVKFKVKEGIKTVATGIVLQENPK